MLVALLDKSLKPYVLAGVLGALDDHVQDRQTVVVAELVEQQTHNSTRHTAKRYNIDNPIKAVLGIFHHPSHAQDSFTLYSRRQIFVTAVNDCLSGKLAGKQLNRTIELLTQWLGNVFLDYLAKLLPSPVPLYNGQGAMAL